jgi:hypothetical protein
MSTSIMILSGCLFSMSVAYLTLFYRFVKIKNQYQGLFIDLVVLNQTIDQMEESSISLDQSVHKENFIKFLSDSRDWAYEYIEEVQTGLKHFIDETAPEINYFRDYSDTMALAPNYYSMKKISEEYEKLKTLLPIEEEAK